MMAAASLFATVIHLETGHVLAAVSSGTLEPTLEDLTGGKHVRVRLPGTREFVDVPSSLLQATRLSVSADMLDRAQNYVVDSKQNPPISHGGAPVVDDAEPTGAEGTATVVVWQDDEAPVATSGPMGAGDTLPGDAPPGAKARLVGVKGKPLNLKNLP